MFAGKHVVSHRDPPRRIPAGNYGQHIISSFSLNLLGGWTKQVLACKPACETEIVINLVLFATQGASHHGSAVLEVGWEQLQAAVEGEEL